MKPVRILNVIGRMDRGGIETLVMNIYRNIDRSLIQFDFLAHYNKPEADFNSEIISLGGRIFEMPQIKTTKSARYHMVFKYRKALKEFFISHQEYEVIHLHMTNTAALLIPIAKKYGNVKVIISHSHLTRAREGIIGLITNVLQRRIEKDSTDYFACSKEASKWFYSDKLIKSGAIKIINNAVDSDKFAFSESTRINTRNLLGISDKFVIGHVGRFFPQKNHKYILQIFERLLLARKNAVLLLIGEGVLKDEIINQAKEKGIQDNIYFLGNRDDVNILMQAMDVFLMPSLFEGLPVVGVEAQASGLPCVFSDVITKEVDIIGSSKFISLESSLDTWVNEILKFELYERKNSKETIVAKGYDIKQIAMDLQKFYLERTSKNE